LQELGVPGDYVLGFYKALEQSELAVINTCDEQGAGFADDPSLPGTAHRSRVGGRIKTVEPLDFLSVVFYYLVK
jgi:hypothetical protein